MKFFTFNHGETESALERALLSTPFSGEIKFNYTGTVKNKDTATASSVYLLPVDSHEGVIYGYFTIDGKLAEVPIGVLRKNNFLFKEHFRPSLNGGIVKQNKPDEGILYLPLKLTDLVLALGEPKEGTFVPHEGSPFSVFGIEGSQGVQPLIFVSETENGIMCRGIYNDKDRQLSTYEHNGMRIADKTIRDFLRELRGVKLVTPQKNNLEKTVHADPIKTSEMTKPLENVINGEINWEEPKSIVAYLDQYVVGQDDAKMVIAVAFSNYMTKVRTKNEELQKDNLLLVGPSGVGKTYMVSLLAKRASLPMVQTKLTGKSTEGYKGENLSTTFEQMRAMTTGEAPYGIIFFDEIDKLARDDWGSGQGFGSRIQDELIGWLEEATVLADMKDDKKAYNGLNTRNILFVTAGAFQSTDRDSSLEGIIRKRLGDGQKQIGFGAQPGQETNLATEQVLPKVRPEDLITYGLKPELVGRLPSLGILRPLTKEDKVRILTATKRSAITNYAQLLSLKGYQVEIDAAVPEVIAGYCPEETGARALNAVCNDLFTEIMFDPKIYADESKVIRVTADLAKKLINLYA